MMRGTLSRRAAHQVEQSLRDPTITQATSAAGRVGVLALLVSTFALHLWSLMRFPAPFCDEGWLASRAWVFLQTHQAFSTLDVGVLDRFEGYWTFYPWLPVWIQSLVLRFSAQPTLLQVRVLSLFFGVLVLVAVYFIAQRLYGKLPGVVAVLLISVSGPFLYSAHLARYDTITAALGFTAIALHLNNRPARAWLSLIAGLCIGLAFEVHPHSVFYAPAILALYFLHHRWSMFRRRDLWAFLIGIGLGFVLYALLHIAPYPRTYLALNQIVFTRSHTPPILTLDLQVLLQAIYDMGSRLVSMELLLTPIIVWAAVALTRRRSEADKTVLILNATLIGGATLLFRIKAAYYAILFSPAIQIMVAAFLVREFQRPWRGRIQDYGRLFLILGACIGTVTLNLTVLRTDATQAYEEALDYMDHIIEPGESVMAPQTYWFGLYDRDYYSWESLIHYQRYAPGSTLEDALRELRPDILVIDKHWAAFISDEPGESGYSQHLHVSRAEMEAFLGQYASLVGVTNIGYDSLIHIYRIAWDQEEPNK